MIMNSLFSFLKSTKTQAYLAYIILIGGGCAVVYARLASNDTNRLFDLMFLTATFYFGSSKSGASKDETIATLANTQSPSTVGKADTVNVTTP